MLLLFPNYFSTQNQTALRRQLLIAKITNHLDKSYISVLSLFGPSSGSADGVTENSQSVEHRILLTVSISAPRSRFERWQIKVLRMRQHIIMQ